MEGSKTEGAAYCPYQPGYARAGTRYLELPYSDDCRLGAYLCQIFEVTAPKSGQIAVIPDGCHDILIARHGEKIESWLSPSIACSMDFRFARPDWIFGVRFLPGAACALFQQADGAFAERAVPLAEIFADTAALEADFLAARSFARRQEIMLDFLARRLPEKNAAETVISFCVARMIRANGLISIEQLAAESGYSVRYIRQLFTQNVGHSPKELANIIRIQKALRCIWADDAVRLGEVAAEYGFSDQSHMNRTFRKFLHITSGGVKGQADWIDDLKAEIARIF